ncbi:hypothetical protein [Phycicoccus mangrovi]|nr:hypothetical protein [Phycicoccus mangrovi]
MALVDQLAHRTDAQIAIGLVEVLVVGVVLMVAGRRARRRWSVG